MSVSTCPKELVAERQQLYERAESGDMRSIVQASALLGICTEQEARDFLQEYGNLIASE